MQNCCSFGEFCNDGFGEITAEQGIDVGARFLGRAAGGERATVALLEANGIDWRQRPEPSTSCPKPESSRLSTEAKVTLFHRAIEGSQGCLPRALGEQDNGEIGSRNRFCDSNRKVDE
jgi:hypothetical protein